MAKKVKAVKKAQVNLIQIPVLGDGAVDRVLGVSGTVTALIEYIDGRLDMQLEWLGENGQPQTAWYPAGRLTVDRSIASVNLNLSNEI